MASVVAFPAAVACALLVAAAVFLVGSASASWHAQVFEVGGEPRGWAKPAAPNGETYNHWAARNRFHVGDFLHKYSCNASIASHFKYDKNDSVLVVSRDDYKFCDAVRPSQRFDGGDTRLRLENSGFSYFISGAPGHCDAGQRMTLRVLPQQQQQDGGSEAAPTGAPGAMAPGGAAGGGGGGDEGGEFGPPHGSGSGSGAGSSVTGPGLMSSSTPPPHPHGGVVGTDANNTSGAAPARAPSSFGGCCHHVVGAVVLGASLLVLGA
ncbi:hypothetical protein SETIT_4G126000v2 [Setaria italica]|uniref:Phytocyanin domain-containing protein n=1 Tax=Setaria italica TaxID=4555 RepID=K3Y1V8_SETIT|nr:hypothetical protein SETIT_4G126000v2 [Setaria italica]